MKYNAGFFAKQLRVKRAERNWSQEDLATAAGVSVNTIARYETGSNIPSFSSVVAIAQAFGCPTDDFYQSQKIPA